MRVHHRGPGASITLPFTPFLCVRVAETGERADDRMLDEDAFHDELAQGTVADYGAQVSVWAANICGGVGWP